jgi:hypothetical protein
MAARGYQLELVVRCQYTETIALHIRRFVCHHRQIVVGVESMDSSSSSVSTVCLHCVLCECVSRGAKKKRTLRWAMLSRSLRRSESL